MADTRKKWTRLISTRSYLPRRYGKSLIIESFQDLRRSHWKFDEGRDPYHSRSAYRIPQVELLGADL